jgi:hypothetical protein
MSEEYEKISEYNQAALQILRLHNAWISCSRHRMEGNLVQYKWDLDNIELELASDIDRLDQKKKEIDKFTNKITKLNSLILFYELNKKNMQYFLKLREKEVLLRIIMERSGKGGKLKFVDEDDFD